MTKEEAAIISAYTGILAGQFNDMHEYVEKIMGRHVFSHEFANRDFAEKIKEKSRADFIALANSVK